ncbi:hypothetical protein ACVWY5_001549 [Bradyrhizobium sp. USDA 3256]
MRVGMQSPGRAVQGTECALSPAVRQCLAYSRVAACVSIGDLRGERSQAAEPDHDRRIAPAEKVLGRYREAPFGPCGRRCVQGDGPAPCASDPSPIWRHGCIRALGSSERRGDLHRSPTVGMACRRGKQSWRGRPTDRDPRDRQGCSARVLHPVFRQRMDAARLRRPSSDWRRSSARPRTAVARSSARRGDRERPPGIHRRSPLWPDATRLDHRREIVGAVVDFVGEEHHPLLRLLARGNVDQHVDRADQPASRPFQFSARPTRVYERCTSLEAQRRRGAGSIADG